MVDDDLPHTQQFFGRELGGRDDDAFVGAEQVREIPVQQPGGRTGVSSIMRIIQPATSAAARILRPGGQDEMQIERQLIAEMLARRAGPSARVAVRAVGIDAVEKSDTPAVIGWAKSLAR